MVPTISTSITASFAARAKTVVTRLTFAPVVAGTTIQVICKAPKHKKCPFAKTTRKITTAVKKVNLLRIFKKQALAPKTVVQIRVTAPGAIGKYRKFVMRKRKAPVKTSRCLRPGSITPTAC